ncbi:MAG: hypothetical protein AAGO57_06790, partial [Pseudomonadota bacterium]
MTVTDTDIKAAVAAGILTEAQAASLTHLSNTRNNAIHQTGASDEPFELFRGFNEVFIVVGIIILATGWSGLIGASFTSQISNVQESAVIYGLIGAAILWGLSEYFIRRRRMVAPAIVLSVYFAGNAAVALTAYFAQPFMVAQEDFSSLPLPFALATLCLVFYWWRFRVPFAMAMLAVGFFIVALLVAATQSGTPESLADLFLLSAGGPFAWITLALGVIVFGVAMAFDMSDPHRVTLRASNGFWLHVVAAPALVNTIALTMLERQSAAANASLVAILCVFALVAIIIDRRSFLLAAIGYSVALAMTLIEPGQIALII